jgi:hypothetical protein
MLDDDANGAAPVAEAASDAAPVADTAPAPAEQPTMRDTMAAVLAKYPTRGDDGKYESRFPAPEPATDAAPAEAAPAAPETTDQPELPAAETAPPAPSIEPPAAWSADAKAKWSTLPPDVQTYIAQREGEAHKAITQAGERLKGYDGLDAVIGPRRDALRATWGNEGAAVEQLFQLSDFATRDPAGFVHWFAQQNRVDLSRLNTAPAHEAPADPQVAALQHELSTIKSTLTQQQMAQMDAEIRSFAEAKDAAGNPTRPHFNDVRTEMGRLMQAGIAATLDDAYAKAIRTNDAVWAKVQAEQAAARAKQAEADEAKRREAQAKAAADAKRAASVNVRAVGAVSGSPARPVSMRESMEAVARKHFGSAA